MRWSIRYQILGPLILLILGLIGVCAWTAMDSARLARQRISEQVHGVIRTLSEAQYPLTDHVFDQLRGFSGAEYLLVYPAGNQVTTLPGPIDGLPAPTSPAEAIADHSLGRRISVGGRSYFCRGVVLRPPHHDAGATLYVLYPESLVDEALWQAVRPSLLLGSTGGVAALLLTVVAARRLVRRIQDLERRTRQIARGDFSPMPLPGSHDELRDLARSVNEMAQRLALFQEAVTRAERARLLDQVSGGLAHQMRNAVTGAKLALQLHAQSCAGGDGEALEVADRQLSRMSADLEHFFELGGARGRWEVCSMVNLIRDAVALLGPQCRHARIDLSWEPPTADILVRGDGGQLGHLLVNLLTNAVEAVGSGGTVEVRLSGGNTAVIEILDSGAGPDPKIAGRIFEPFITGKSQGIGLGLAVAKQVTESHGGTISWRREGGRTCFRVELPAHSELRTCESYASEANSDR
jgi:signal transduction histidine kinase